ncbi:hypothetical protein ACIPUC_10180 [Streptomyces sp. LARHCF249]
MNSPSAGESGCDLMKRIAKELRASIKAAETNAAELARRIAELEAQPDPDEKQINALKQTLEALNKKIEEDRLSLSTLEDVISENC